MSSKLIGRPRRRDSDEELYGDTPPMPCEPGPFMRRFQDKFTKQLQELCGDNGEALVKLCKVKDFSEVVEFCDSVLLRHVIVSSVGEFIITCLCWL